MKMKLAFSSIIVLGLLFSCIKAAPASKRSNRVSRELKLSFSKILTLSKDFYKTATDFDTTAENGLELLNALRKTLSLFISTPYRATEDTINRLEEIINFGLSIPGEVGNAAVNTILAPYRFTKSAVNALGDETKKTVNYGLHVQKQVTDGIANVAMMPYTVTKRFLNWLGI